LTQEKKLSFKEKIIKAFDYKLQIFIFIFVVFISIFSDSFRIPTSGRQLISLNIIALVAGIIFESVRLTQRWSTIIYSVWGSLMVSFIIIVHGYNFEEHVQMWPYSFIVVFSTISVIIHNKRLIPKLTEGITLIQSLALIYWIINNDFLSNSNLIVKLIVILILLPTLYSAYHALSYSVLTKTKRFLLSLWSSIIMVLFALDNIYGIYHLGEIESTSNIYDKIYIGLAYFLLGVSTIYIIKNSMLLLGFWPDRDRKYSRQFRKLKNVHVDRYSDMQVNVKHSALCIIYATLILGCNHFMQILEGHLAIWIVFITFPFIIKAYDFVKEENKPKKTEAS
jgi:hypothetical protein